MAIDAIGTTGTATSDALRNSGISQESFLRILLTQLRFQDPLKPMDNEQFVAQLAQFSALEINRQQSEKIDTLLSIQAVDQSVALLGKNVELAGVHAGTTGSVIAVSFASGEPRLSVKTPSTTFIDVRLSDVKLVTSGAQ
jgi:flagellar basal-body rod modification protein FlgD